MTAEPIPHGYSSGTPWIISRDAARLIDYLAQAFEAEEIARVLGEGNRDHAEVRIGDSIVMLFDSRPGWPPTPAFLRLYVPDATPLTERLLPRVARR